MTQNPAGPRPASKPRRRPSGSVGHTPTPVEIGAAKLLLEPWQWLTAPQFRGVKNVPARRPFLLVGNHILMGVLDVPLLVLGLYEAARRSDPQRDLSTRRLERLKVSKGGGRW